MEMYQLRAYVTAATLGSVTRTAETLHLTQPAITAQIKALESAIKRYEDRLAAGDFTTESKKKLGPDSQQVAALPMAISPAATCNTYML